MSILIFLKKLFCPEGLFLHVPVFGRSDPMPQRPSIPILPCAPIALGPSLYSLNLPQPNFQPNPSEWIVTKHILNAAQWLYILRLVHRTRGWSKKDGEYKPEPLWMMDREWVRLAKTSFNDGFRMIANFQVGCVFPEGPTNPIREFDFTRFLRKGVPSKTIERSDLLVLIISWPIRQFLIFDSFFYPVMATRVGFRSAQFITIFVQFFRRRHRTCWERCLDVFHQLKSSWKALRSFPSPANKACISTACRSIWKSL